MFILIFVVAQFIAIFRKSNIGMIVAAWLASLLEHMTLSGIPLVLISLILIALANFLLTSPASKWMIFSPIMVPMFMQSNISPQFATGTAWSREPRSPPSVGTTWRSQKGLAFGLKALTAPPLC